MLECGVHIFKVIKTLNEYILKWMMSGVRIIRLGMPYDQSPKERDLQRFIIPHGGQWRDIGIQLGLESSVLNQIETDYSNQRERFRVTLEKWLKLDVVPTWRTLELAITNANRMHLDLQPLSSIMLTSEPEGKAPQLESQLIEFTQVQESTASVQHGIYFAFEELNGQFYEVYNKDGDAAHISDVLRRGCKKLYKCRVKFSRTSMRKIFDKLSDLPFLNFLDVDLLMFLATSTVRKGLIDIVKAYKATYFSMKLNEIIKDNRKYVEKIKITNKGKKIFQSIYAKFPEEMTIEGLKDCIIQFSSKILCIEVGLASPISYTQGCICVEWLIPSQLADYTYHSACINTESFFELGLLQLEFGRRYQVVPVKRSDGCLHKYPMQIFCDHYQLLMENMESESFLLKCQMQQTLLSNSELYFIQTAPIDLMKNLYIIEKIRHMEMPHLFIFLDILQETCDEQHMYISGTLVRALKGAGFTRLLDSNVEAIQAGETLESPPSCVFEYDKDEIKSSLEKFKSERKRLLSPPDVNKQEYFLPSIILLKYLDLFDKLLELLDSVKPKILIDAVSSILAIDTYKYHVKQFSPDFIEQLSCCTNSTEVLVKVFPYSNWCDHSIIRELLELCNCSAGVQLVDEFDSRIDLVHPIKDCPIPVVSSPIVPSNLRYYTVMAIKCQQKLCSLSLYNIGALKSELIQKCNLNKYACIFLAVTKSDPVVFHWLIPSILLFPISDAVEKFSGYLNEKGILEIAIYPKFVFSTIVDNTSRVVPSSEVTDGNGPINENDTETGGYDYVFVETLEDRLICKICGLASREPQVSACCGEVFCKSCLEETQKMKQYHNDKSCPWCRKSVFDTYPHVEADRRIRSQRIHCPNKDNNGCQWTGEINNIKEHIVNGKCRDKVCNECEEVIQYTAIKYHPTVCPCYCQYCGTTAGRDVISSEHKDNCTKFPRPCPNNCGDKAITTGNLPQHKSTCPYEMIECEYYDVGCETQLRRNEQDQHNTIMKAYHRQLLSAKDTAEITKLFIFSMLLLYVMTTILLNVINDTPQPARMNNDKLGVVNLDTWKQLGTMLPINSIYVAPVILRLSNFSERFESTSSWYTVPFLAFKGGYQMCLMYRTYVVNNQFGEDSYLSVYLYLMKGPYDDELQESGHWPLRGIFTIELLDQLDDKKHHSNTFLLNYDICKMCTYRVHPLWPIVSATALHGYGIDQFIHHDTFYHNNSGYLINNTAYFKLSFEDTGYQPSNDYYFTEYVLWPLIIASWNWLILFLPHLPISRVESPHFLFSIWLILIVAGFPEGMVWIISYAVVFWISATVKKTITANRSSNIRFYITSLLGSVILVRVLLTIMKWSLLMNLKSYGVYFILGFAIQTTYYHMREVLHPSA